MITGDHVGIIDTQQLSKGVPGEGNILEGILLGASHARDKQQACREGKPDYVERYNRKAIGATTVPQAFRRLSGEKFMICFAGGMPAVQTRTFGPLHRTGI